jgi:hypothetical protein
MTVKTEKVFEELGYAVEPVSYAPQLHTVADRPVAHASKFKVSITVVQTFDDEESALQCLKQFAGEGNNRVTLTHGNKILSDTNWGYHAGKHGSRHIDGDKYHIRFINDER